MTSAATGVTVISLPRAGERRAHFAAAAANAGLPWEFFDARTGIAAPLQYDERGARRTHGRVLTAGELGAYASHYAVWERLIASKLPQMIVLEDDVVVDWTLIARLASMDFAGMGISYMRLFAKIPPRFRKLRCPFIDRYHHLIRITSYALGTQAYLITREGAERFMSGAQRVESPIDAYMDKYWRHDVPNLALYPFPVFERFDSSSIGEARFERRPIPIADQLALISRRMQDRFAMVKHASGLAPGRLERALLRRLPQE
jgi:glycosyl transferase family 25